MKLIKLLYFFLILVFFASSGLAFDETASLYPPASGSSTSSESLFNVLMTRKSDSFWQCESDARNGKHKGSREKYFRSSRRKKIADIPIYVNKTVQAFIDLYNYKKRKAFRRAIKRSAKYMKMIRRILKEHELPMDLAYLPVVESNFNPKARSKANAVGLWQFISSTGKMFGLEKSRWHDERYDPEKSTVAAAKYLKHLIKKFDGKWELALAAYNSGETTVENAVKKARRRNKPTDFWSLKLPRETRGYVPAFMAVVTIFHDLDAYGFKPSPVWLDEPRKQFVKAPGGSSLKQVARILNINYRTVQAMNPALHQGIIVPAGHRQYEVAIPARIQITESQLEKLAALRKPHYGDLKRYEVIKGDTLWSISQRWGTSVDVIRNLNPSLATSNMLRIGQTIILPVRQPLSSERYRMAAEEYSGVAAVHKVIKGDTLYAISRRYNVPIKKIRYLNPEILQGKVLEVGSEVVLKETEQDESIRYY